MNHSQQQLDTIVSNAATVGLVVNISKTEQMRVNLPKGSNPPYLNINGEKIKTVTDFKYLGSRTEVDVHARIALAWVAFHNLKSILKSSRVSIKF